MSRSHEGHYGTRHTTLWSSTCTHIRNIIDLSGKTTKLWFGQASLRRSRRSGRKNQTKTICPGADPGFPVRGGGAHLKKLRRAEGGAKYFWGILCEKSRLYAKKSYFFQLRREPRKLLGYFVWKITILRQKIIFFPNFRGGAAPGAPPPPPPPPLGPPLQLYL